MNSFEQMPPQVAKKETTHGLESYPNIERREVLEDAVEVFIVGKNTEIPEDQGWSMRFLKKNEDVTRPENEHILRLFADFTSEMSAAGISVNRFLALVSIPHNGKIDESTEFNEEILLPNGKLLYRGSNTEGCLLQRGDVFVVSPADCLTVIAKSDKGIIASHAGRESLFNIDNPDGPNVVKSILDILGPDTKFWTGFGIHAGEHFKHDETNSAHGERTKQRREALQYKYGPTTHSDGNLDMHGILVDQIEAYGGERSNVTVDKTFCTFNETDEDGIARFYSQRREGLSRNLVFVIVK
ncbi:MAG: hypothetical protein RI996_101 [Candidatus Parcubacteria bacterium]|jgi:hypothetical protein